MQEIEILLGAVRHALFGDAVPAVSDPALAARVIAMARSQDMLGLLAEGLLDADCGLPETAAEELLYAAGTEFNRYLAQQRVYAALTDAFERAGIDYMPLKGLVLSALYPRPELRIGRDMDVLVRSEDFPRACALARTLDPRHVTEGSHDFSFQYEGDVVLELHYRLFEPERSMSACLEDPWAGSLPLPGRPHGRRMSDVDSRLYLLSHMAKHFQNGGCGLRPFLDLFLLRRAVPLDAAALAPALRAAGLSAFARAAEHQADVLFGGLPEDADSARLTDFIARHHAFGSGTSAAAMRKRAGEREADDRRYALRRAFPPLSAMVYLYPFLRRLPVLLPLCWLLRALRIFSRRDRDRFLSAVRSGGRVSEEELREIDQVYRYIGL